MNFNNETIAAVATALNDSGIGIIRVSGDDAIEIVNKIYRSPGKKQLVDFELADITLQASDRMEITTAESYNGTQSKMLHVFRADYAAGSPTLFNARTTYNDDSDPVFTFKVDPNSVYKVTFYAKVKSDSTLKSPWFGVHASNHSENAGHRPRIANIVGNTKDAWLKYTYYLETKSNQTNAVWVGSFKKLSHTHIYIYMTT